MLTPAETLVSTLSFDQAGDDAELATPPPPHRMEHHNMPADAYAELVAHRMQMAKRFSLFLNQRLEASMQEWRDALQSEPESPRSAALAATIADQRRAVEEVLQMMITLQPKRAGTPSPTMALNVKARFQGTPVSALKPVSLSHNWLQTLVVGQSTQPQFGCSSGPAQRWRFRFASSEPIGDLSS